MRIPAASLLLTLLVCACGSQREPQREGPVAPAPLAAGNPDAAKVSTPQAALMAIPEDPAALERLKSMGYTVHAEQGHLHAPGVNSCPQMGDNPVM